MMWTNVDQLITAVRKILDATETKRKADEEEERNRAQRETEQRRIEVEAQRKAEEERLREQERQRAEEARRKTDKENRARIGQEFPNPWRTYGPVVAAVAVVLVIFSFFFWWPKPQVAPIKKAEGQKEIIKQLPVVETQPRKTKTGFSLEEITFALREGLQPSRILSLVRERGLNFDVTPEVENRLKQARADAEFIKALKSFSDKTYDVGVSSVPDREIKISR
jgi:hypothetical protein